MKRSKSLSLILMGSLALGSAGCGSDKVEESYVAFSNVDECVRSGLYSRDECDEFDNAARRENPSFISKEECERRFGAGACQESPENKPMAAASNSTVRQGSGSMWMPMMMGFMAGRFMGSGGPMQGSQPLYRQPDDDRNNTGRSGGAYVGRSFRTAGGDTITTDTTGRVSNPSSQLKQSLSHSAKPMVTRGSSASRGGFFGFGGGSS